jgi:carboxyl-terminal processing protease
MEIGIRKEQLVVVAPLKGTPAERAGLLPGDKILTINGEDTRGLDVQSAVKKIRGEPGTVVKLEIFRDGWENSREFAIRREIISVPTLDMEMREGNIAYIQLYNFNDNASSLFYRALRKAAQEGAEGIVLDLRNNPGGFLNVAVELAGWFVDRGTVVVSEEDAKGNREPLYTYGNGALKNIPTVVLINGGSASASEILAGALRDIRGVKLIGEKSFGKGTVQKLEHLSDGSIIKITVAHWVLPSGAILDKNGLEPDIKVERTEKDIQEKRDPQLDRALEEIKKEIELAKVRQ